MYDITQVEEFGREMYKLCKTFNSKAKQVARDKEKQSGGDLEGVKRDAIRKDTRMASLEDTFAPLKLSSQVQDNIKQFKVIIHVYACMYVQ